jgi:hypothetical protein
VRRCPQLTPQQINDRLNWCLEHIDCNFDYHIFVDESKIMINHCKLYHMGQKATYPECIILNNFHAKLNIWGGISKRGATSFVVYFLIQYCFNNAKTF